MSAETILLILKLLDLVASVAIRGAAVQNEFSQLRSELETMVREGREPTTTEWVTMNERADALHQELQTPR